MLQKLGKSVHRMGSTISDDLLISISMASHKNFKSQQELADHYQQIELITDDTLHGCFGQLDRATFADNKNQNFYGNHLIKLNKYDNMTTPIMHAFPANEIIKHINQGDRILDAGTGFGYFAFLLQSYAESKNLTNVKVSGIDVDSELIANCQRIQDTLKPKNMINFHEKNILSLESLDYELINIGFGVDDEMVKRIQQISKPKTVHLICPLIAPQEQWLTYLRITREEITVKRLMKCLFQSAKSLDHKSIDSQGEKINVLQQREQNIEAFIKEWNKNYVALNNIKPTLEVMSKDVELQEKLKEYKLIKREILIAQRPME